MGDAIAIPKQQAELSFEPISWLNVTSYIKLSRALDFKHLGIEFQPVVDRFWEYNPHVWAGITFFDPSKERFINTYNFLADNQTSKRSDWVVLPEKARVIVKKDISIKELFEAIIPRALCYYVPDRTGDLLYHLPILFREGVEQRKLQEQLNDLLDNPQLESKTISTTIVGNEPGQKIKLEFVITEFAGWQFVRLLSIKYGKARFEHYVKAPVSGNVYSPNSTSIGTLKRDYYIAFTKSEVFWACEELMYDFLHYSPRRTLINKDMGLHLKIHWHQHFQGQRKLEGQFDVFEPDYTTFIDGSDSEGGAT